MKRTRWYLFNLWLALKGQPTIPWQFEEAMSDVSDSRLVDLDI